MKKILGILVMMSFILGFIGVVMAVDQGAQVTILPDIQLTPTPNPIDYGTTLIPGDESVVEITLTPGASDLDVSVSITGDSLIQGILVDRDGDTSYDAYDGDSFLVFANTPLVFNTKLVVPSPYASGAYSGTITYTVMEYIED